MKSEKASRAVIALIAAVSLASLMGLLPAARAQESPNRAEPGVKLPPGTAQQAEDEVLEPYMSRPNERIVVTFNAKRLLKEPALLEGIEKSAQVSGVWIGADRGGRVTALNYRPLQPGESPAGALDEYRSAFAAVIPLLEQSRPSPDAVLPDADDFGIYSFVVDGTPAEVTSFRNAAFARALGVRAVEAVTEAQNALRNAPKLPDKAPQSNLKGDTTKAAASGGVINAVTASTPRKFLPNRGSVSVFARTENGHEYRYVVHWLKWDNQQSINDFFDDDAYEHQLVLYKGQSSPGLYLRDPGAWGLVNPPPWQASWNGGYLDSSVLNGQIAGNKDETDYTIGCIHPRSALQAGQWYYLWARFEKGDANTDVGKLTGEAKQRRPSSCYHPFCVLGPRDVTQWVINAWKIPIPTSGDFNWLRPQVTEVSTLTTAVGGKQFFLKVRGGGFDPTSARVVVMGPGCTTFGACQVPNSVLRQSGGVTATDIERAPLTLSAGTYNLYVINGNAAAFTRQIEDEGFPVTVAAAPPTPPLRLNSVTPQTTPVAGQQFIARLVGSGFDTSHVRVVVTGPGCATFGACQVPNNVLRSFGSVTSTTIERAPLTLGLGTYSIYVQNGTSARDATAGPYSLTVQAPALRLNSVTPRTTPVAGQQFVARVTGSGIDPARVRIVVTGPGCATFGPCQVPNNVLRSFGSVTSTTIERAPLTLGVGTYQVYLQNGSSFRDATSAPYNLTVQPAPLRLNSVTPQTTPVAGRQFIARITGTGFDPARVRVVVTGPGCPTFGLCQVPNNVLRSFGSVTATLVDRAPMTLGKGTYNIYVQNGSSARDAASNAVTLTIR